jgi:putative nucleotidyltransferase with HDIG domain
MMASAPELVVDEARIKKAIQSGIPITITTYTLPAQIEVYIEQVIDSFLKMTNESKLKEYIVYSVKELVINAQKANIKRLYFSEHGLDIDNQSDYNKGIVKFKDEMLEKISHYQQLQRDKGLYIKFFLQLRRNTIYIEVRNNVTANRFEHIRIHDKLARSRQYNNMEEVLSQSLVDSEGSGLGLIVLILILKKMGLEEECFNFKVKDTYTTASLSIPLDEANVEQYFMLSKTIAASVNSLPQFPENIIHIQKLVDDPNVQMPIIARHISMDPALTADILKIVNSAQFMLSQKVDSIYEAVKMIGIRGIKNLLISYGTQKILGDNTTEKKQLWEHSYKTAFYAHNLFTNFKKNRVLLDDIYAGGILHDIGKIIFFNENPDLLFKIKEFSNEKNLPVSVFEDLCAGMNHAELGALIAEKWNFPERLVIAIRYHHDPGSVDKEYKDLVDAVYLANIFCDYENGNISFDQIETNSLVNFGINSKQQIDSLIENFSSKFNEEGKV